MSDANRVGLAYVVESTYGVTPSGPPTLKNVRYTGESLKQDTETKTSLEIRSDRQVSDLIRTNLSTSGDVNVELSYAAFDDWLEWALLSDASWTSALDITINSASINITIAASGSNFTLTRASGSYVTDGFSATLDVGKWVKLGSTANPFTLAANNGYAKIVSVSATVLTVTGLAMSATTQSSGTVAIRRCAQILNGVLLKSMTIEKSFPDLTNEFAILTGQCIDGLSLDVSIGSILTGTFSFIGAREASATATVGSGTNTAAATNNVGNTIDNISGVLEGGSALQITKFTMELKNNLRARQAVGTLGAISIGTGTVAVTGTIEAYFTSKTLADKYRNFTATSIGVKFVDSAGNAYVIDLPRVKFGGGDVVAGGINQDVIVKLQYTAYMHETELKTLRLVRSVAN